MDKNVYTVSQINKYVGGLLREDFLLHRITVTGEVSNYKDHSSGHIYLTLKDENAELRGVMFASRRAGLKGRIQSGDKVIATGEISLYEKTGVCQIYIDRLEKAGVGDIYARIEALKKELREMGMFDPMYKKQIPPYARSIGIVTAPTGAAVRDIIQITRRRNPYIQLVLCPAIVQGKDAPASIANGIRRLDAMGLDVIIAGRGGGSVEDLFAFNTEEVARAIFEAQTPIVSAVGHETDTTIADHVADLRAPTPSAAAELCAFDYYEFQGRIAEKRQLLTMKMKRSIMRSREQAMHYEKVMAGYSPATKLSRLRSEQKRLRSEMTRLMQLKLERTESVYQALSNRFSGIMPAKLERSKAMYDRLQERLKRAMPANLEKSRVKLALLAGRLDGASPAKKLSKGYAFVRTAEGKRIAKAGDISVGDVLDIRFLKGGARAQVEEIYDG